MHLPMGMGYNIICNVAACYIESVTQSVTAGLPQNLSLQIAGGVISI